ncbi:MAG: TetR/AcrR family transcriptional regulator [Proteobacteria bacterium]|nr:TetR/AcrR family transcriptional regulator [Pseudomonadota bacterium]MDA1057830.1 TetR/AcrR family transcriptional regulator [Pseudomonadota bacterium]
MARQKSFSPDEALDQAMGVFWRKGFADCSVDDLVAATGVSRYGLYSTFGEKDELFAAALDCYAERVIDPLFGPLEHENAGLADIHGYFARLVAVGEQPQARFGCMLCNSAIDADAVSAPVARRVTQFLGRLQFGFLRALENAKRTGDLSPDSDPKALADYLVGIVQGISAYAQAPVPPAAIHNFMRMAVQVLK